MRVTVLRHPNRARDEQTGVKIDDITPLGWRQIGLLGNRFAERQFAFVVHSGLRRTRLLAQKVAGQAPILEIPAAGYLHLSSEEGVIARWHRFVDYMWESHSRREEAITAADMLEWYVDAPPLQAVNGNVLVELARMASLFPGDMPEVLLVTSSGIYELFAPEPETQLLLGEAEALEFTFEVNLEDIEIHCLGMQHLKLLVDEEAK